MKKSAVSLVLAIILAVSLSACAGKSDPQTSSKNTEADPSPPSAKKYIIGTDTTYPPFEYEQNGEYVGIDIELIKAIAAEAGFEIEIRPMDFKGIIPAIQSKQLDAAIAGINIREDRKKIVDFSDPYYDTGDTLVVRADDDTINGPEDLKGKTIAIKKGTSGAKLAEQFAKQYGAIVKYFDDSSTMFQEVVNKNADATIEDFPVISYKLKMDPNAKLKIAGGKLTSSQNGIAVNKDNKELLKLINEGLKKVKENGTYDEIIKKYTGS